VLGTPWINEFRLITLTIAPFAAVVKLLFGQHTYRHWVQLAVFYRRCKRMMRIASLLGRNRSQGKQHYSMGHGVWTSYRA